MTELHAFIMRVLTVMPRNARSGSWDRMIDSATAPYAALLLCWCLGAMLIAQALLNGDAPRSPERSSCSGR